MNSYKQRHAIWQKITLKGILLPLFIFGLLFTFFFFGAGFQNAQAATANTLNFQGRLLTSAGDLVPDGSYNIEFKIYDTLNLGTSAPGVCSLNSTTDDCWWIESRTVTVQNGYYSEYLGSVTPFGSSVPWDQDLWLTMNVESDGEMSPRFKLTAVPYAFRAGALVTSGGVAKTADDLAQLSPTAIQTLNTAVGVLRLNQTGSGSLLQLQGNGADVFTVDKSGNTVLGAGITLGNSSSTTAGTIRWNGSSFEGYNGSLWASLGSSAVTPFASKTKNANEIQNNVVNPTAVLQPDDQLFFPIGANETWNYRFVLQITGNATPDIKFSVTAPVGATCVAGVSEAENSLAVGNLGCGVSSGLVPMTTSTDIYEVVGSVTNGVNAGNLTLNWAQNTANAANVTVLSGSFLEASRSVGGSSADVAFIQNGNSFGGLAVLGTNDANGLAFETNGLERLQILSSGEIQAKDDILANRITTGVTGTTVGTGTNTTALTLTADNFNLNDVVLVDNVGQDYYTRITVDPGTGNYTVSPAITFEAGRTVTSYTVQNIGATTTDYTSQANRFFQGYFLGGVVVGAGSTTITDGSIESTTTLRIQQGGGDVEIGGGLTVTGVLSGDASGLTNVSGASVDGATVTSLNASNISSGTLADARLSSNVTLLGNTFNGINQLVRLGAAGELPTLNGAAVTSLNASNISSGTLADARLSTNVTLLGNTFNGNSQLVQLTAGGLLPALNGSGLTSLNAANLTGTLAAIDGSALTNLSAGNLTGALPAISGASLTSLNGSNISSGTVADARLSSNVTLLGNTFNGINQLVQLGTAGELPTLNGAAITSLNGSNISSGTLADARLSSNVTLLGNTFNGNSQLVQLTAGGLLPALNGSGLTSLNAANLTGTLAAIDGSTLTNLSAGNLTGAISAIDGSALTSLNASNISSGTVADARLSANIALLNGGQTFSALTTFGAGLSVTGGVNASGAVSGATITGDGSGVTAISATNISSGTLGDGRLSANVALLSGLQTFSGLKTFSSGLVLGQSTITSNATVARAVILPDEAGTICFSNTDTCGFLRLASGSLQTDASNNDVLAVNKTTGTGNLINLQRSGVLTFTVANSGALQIQSTSTAALDIRNAGGTSFFSVDSSTGIVRVGPAAADGTGVLFVLDTKNTIGDPTGTNGASYYNSNTNTYRCFRGINATDNEGAWENCGTNPIERAYILEDEFIGGGITSGTVGDRSWTYSAIGAGASTYSYNNATAPAVSASRPGIFRFVTSATSGRGSTLQMNQTAGTHSVALDSGQTTKFAIAPGAAITTQVIRAGLHNETTTVTAPTTGVWIEYDSAASANWRYCYANAVPTPICANSSIAVATTTFASIEIRITALGVGTSSAEFFINGTKFSVSAITINTTNLVSPALTSYVTGNVARDLNIDYFQFKDVSSARR